MYEDEDNDGRFPGETPGARAWPRSPTRPGRTDVRLLTSIGSLVAGAMHQARLHRQLAAREQAAERFAEQVIAARRSPNCAGWPRTSMTRLRGGW